MPLPRVLARERDGDVSGVRMVLFEGGWFVGRLAPLGECVLNAVQLVGERAGLQLQYGAQRPGPFML